MFYDARGVNSLRPLRETRNVQVSARNRVIDAAKPHLMGVTHRSEEVAAVREINRREATRSLSRIVSGGARRLPGHGNVLLSMTAVDDRGFTHVYEAIEVPLESMSLLLESLGRRAE